MIHFNKNTPLVLLLIALFLLIFSCQIDSPFIEELEKKINADSALPTIQVAGISLEKINTSLTVSATEQLNYTISPVDATDKSVTWSSDDENIVTVDSSGLIEAIAEGSTDVHVSTNDGDFTDTCTVTVIVTVEIVPVTGVSLDQSNITVAVNDTQQLTATVEPSDATDKSVRWESSNDSVALVDSSGLITAQSEGTTTISVYTNDGDFTDSCTVYTSISLDIYVHIDGNDAQIGTSFEPKATIQAAIEAAASRSPTVDVRVSGGTYVINSSINNIIEIQAGVSIYGGYNPTNWNDRDPSSFVTAVENDGTSGGSSFTPTCTVLISGSSIQANTILDGMSIYSGTGDSVAAVIIENSASPTLINLRIYGSGADTYSYGLFCSYAASTTSIEDSYIYGGSGSSASRGIFNSKSSPTIVRSSISGGDGGYSYGIYNVNDSSPIIRNCNIHGGTSISAVSKGIQNSSGCNSIIVNNTIYSGSGYERNYAITTSCSSDNTKPVIENNILFATTGTYQYGIDTFDQGYDSDPSSLQNNCFWGFDTALYSDDVDGDLTTIKLMQEDLQAEGKTASGNFRVDPHFLDIDGLDNNIDTMEDNDWRLSSSSSIFITQGGLDRSADFTMDHSGNPRSSPWSVGSFEYDISYSFVDLFVHAGNGHVNNPGTADDPLDNLNAAISKASNWGIDADVHVSEGLYEVNWDESTHIIMVEGVSFYGGYSASNWGTRDPNVYTTTVRDVSIGGGTHTYNTVFYCDSSVSNVTSIDGFVIEGGTGGCSCGILVVGGSLTISNNTIYGGDAINYSRGIYCRYSSGTIIEGNAVYAQGPSSSRSYGIIDYNSSSIIENNFVDGGKANDSTAAISGSGSSSSIIIKNTAYGGESSNTRAVGGSYESDSIAIINNVLHGGIGSSTYGVYVASPGIIRNNTINGGNASNTSSGVCVGYETGTPIIDNNIIFTTGGSYRYGINESTPAPSNRPDSVRNNEFYDTPTAIYHDYNNNNYTSITSMESALTADGVNTSANISLTASYLDYADYNGTDNDPDTMEDNDWDLTGSTNVNISTGGLNGQHSTENWSYHDDREGVTRTPSDDSSTTGWSMGAYEH